MSRSLYKNRDLEKLEPYEGKLSSTVLRGEEGSNALDLPDRRMGSGIAMEDSLYRLPRLPEDKLMALNEIANPAVKPRKSYPWTFNFGYASNAGAGGTLSNLDYLSVVDYANGGAAAKLYTWNDYIDYMNRNAALMDSVERAKLYYIAKNNMTDGNAGLNETAHHDRPKTFGLSLNKQLSPRWIFGTGLTYTKLKSEFVSEYIIKRSCGRFRR